MPRYPLFAILGDKMLSWTVLCMDPIKIEYIIFLLKERKQPHPSLPVDTSSPNDSKLRIFHLSLLELVINEPLCIHSSAHSRFTSLEVLSLDDNRLSDPSVFVSLSHLCR